MADYRWENLELVGRIEVALARIKGVNFSVGVRRLLGVMGYESERVWEGRSGGFERGIALAWEAGDFWGARVIEAC